MNEIESYMSEITGGKTVPRIFIGGQFIGGSDSLASLHSSKKLAEILTKSGALWFVLSSITIWLQLEGTVLKYKHTLFKSYNIFIDLKV